MKKRIKTSLVSLLILLIVVGIVGALSACKQQNKENRPLLYVYGINSTVGNEQVYNGRGEYNPDSISSFGYASDPDDKATVLIDNSTYVCRRDTGVEFAEGEEFTFEFNGVTVTQAFHVTKGDVCIFKADFGGCVAEVGIYKNGDFRWLQVKHYDGKLEPSNEYMTSEELDIRSREVLNFYNRNLITGEPIVNLDEYKPSPYYDVDYNKTRGYLRMPQKNGWWIQEGAYVAFSDIPVPRCVYIINPGHYDYCSVPAAVDESILEKKLTPLLKQYGLISEDEKLLLNNNGFPQGTPSIELSSLTDGTLGLNMRIHISKNGEWTGATQIIFVPFETLGLD